MTYQEALQKSREVYMARTPKSKAAFEEARKYMAGGECRSIACFDPYPFTVEYGEGCRIHDLDGNVYIDFLNNYTSLIHGHAHPAHPATFHVRHPRPFGHRDRAAGPQACGHGRAAA